MEPHFGWVLAQSRRGMKELDLILEKFNHNQYHKITSTQKTIYHRLLQEEDYLLWDWLFDLSPLPQEYQNLMKILKSGALNHHHL